MPPTENLQSFLGDDPLEQRLNLSPRLDVVREKDEAGAVRARGRQIEAKAIRFRAQECVGHLDQDARAISRCWRRIHTRRDAAG